MRALIPFCLSLVGCQYLALEPLGLSCDALHDCPSGLACQDGHCAAATGSDLGSPPDVPCLEAPPPSPRVMEVGRAQAFVSSCDVVIVGDQAQDRLQLIDPGAERVIDTVVLRVDPATLAKVGDSVWVSSPVSSTFLVVQAGGVTSREAPGPVTGLVGGRSRALVAFLEGAVVQQTRLRVLDRDGQPVTGSGPAFVGHTSLGLWDEARGRAVTSSDSTVRSWALDGGSVSMTGLLALDGPVSAMAVSDDGSMLAVASPNGVAELDGQSLSRRGAWATGPGVVSLVFADDLLLVATQTEISTWDRSSHVRRGFVELPMTPQCSSVSIRQAGRSAGASSLLVLADCGRSVTKSLLFRLPMPR